MKLWFTRDYQSTSIVWISLTPGYFLECWDGEKKYWRFFADRKGRQPKSGWRKDMNNKIGWMYLRGMPLEEVADHLDPGDQIQLELK